MPKEYVNPPTLFPSQQYGFSQVVTSRGGTTVYLSGQVGWDAQQQIGVPGDFAAQTRRAFANVEAALQAVGGSRDDVVSLRIYIVGDAMRHAQVVREELCAFFHPDRMPTSTWIGVMALANADFLIEIEAVAVIDEVEGVQ